LIFASLIPVPLRSWRDQEKAKKQKQDIEGLTICHRHTLGGTKEKFQLSDNQVIIDMFKASFF